MAASKLKFQRILIVFIDRSTVGTAQLDSVRGYARQYGFEVQSRADGLTNLAERSQFSDRSRQFACPRLEFLEQAHVLDRDNRLVGEGFEKLNLPFSERPDLHPTNHDCTDSD